MMIFNIIVSILASLVLFSLLMYVLKYNHSKAQNLQQRIEFFSDDHPAAKGESTLSQLKRKFIDSIHDLGEIFQNLPKNNFFDLKMQQAGWSLRGSEFQIILLILGAVTAAVFFFFTLQVYAASIGFMVGILFGLLVLRMRIARRKRAFANQLSDMLKMIADAMRAGYGFMQALEYISREMNEPASQEVQMVVRETTLNVPLEDALEHMCQRVQNSDFDLVVTAVLIQRHIGGNLSYILDTISVTVNDRIRMRREIMTLTAQGRLSGVILAILPFAMGLFINFINPDYMRPLFESNLGYYAIFFGIVMEIIGFMVIKKIVDIDV